MVQLSDSPLSRVQVVLGLSLWSGRGNGIWRKYHIKSEFLKNRLLKIDFLKKPQTTVCSLARTNCKSHVACESGPVNALFLPRLFLLFAPLLAAPEKGPLSSVSRQRRACCGIHGAAGSASEACNAAKTPGSNLG